MNFIFYINVSLPHSDLSQVSKLPVEFDKTKNNGVINVGFKKPQHDNILAAKGFASRTASYDISHVVQAVSLVDSQG